MQFKKVNSPERLIKDAAVSISQQLKEGRRVLLLLTGGSTIPIAVRIRKSITGSLANLSISLTDERPGPVGHSDSNWLQLESAGLELANVKNYPILQNQPLKKEVESFDKWLSRELKKSDYSMGFFGIGPDGHTAGILPGDSLKINLSFAQYYDDGERQRITISPNGIGQLDEIAVYLTGESKRSVMTKLQGKQDPKKFPAEYLKGAKKLTVYNDWVEGTF